MGLVFYDAVKTQKLSCWVLLGLFAGLGILAKYYTVALLFSMFLFILMTAEGRKSFSKPGAYLSVIIALIVISPNLFWLITNNLVSIHYAISRGTVDFHLLNHIIHPLQFTLDMLFAIAPAIIIFLLLGRPRKITPLPDRFDNLFLLFLGLGPFLLTILLSFITGLRLITQWGTPLFSYLGIMLFAWFKPDIKDNAQRFVRGVILVFILGLLVYGSMIILGPYITGKGERALFPGPDIAAQVTKDWHSRFKTSLPFVAGSRWLAGNVGFYSPDRPVAYFDWSQTASPWVNEHELREKGAVFIWNANVTSITREVTNRHRFH